MKKLLLMLALAGAGSAAYALPNPTEVIPAKGGAIRITPIYHGSLQIEYKGTVFQIDPFSAGDYTGAKKADYILITHSHPDHLDAKAIAKVLKPTTQILVSPGVAKTPTITAESKKTPVQTLRNGEKFRTANFDITAVASYNLVRGPKPNQKFHPKGEFDGYVLNLGGKRIYIAGDTEAVPEMKALKNIDVAFLPMNLPFTMTPQEAAAGSKAFKPKVVYPYHYRYPFDKPNNNPQQFAKALEGTGIQVRLRGWYAHPAK